MLAFGETWKEQIVCLFHYAESVTHDYNFEVNVIGENNVDYIWREYILNF